MKTSIFREVTSLTPYDCFSVISREKKEFDFPIHSHEEMELNLILNAPSAKRFIGNHIEEIGGMELVLLSPNLPHGWATHACKSQAIREVTIQFQKDLFPDGFLNKSQLASIRKMIEYSQRGLLFSPETIETLAPRILSLDKRNGFDSILELYSILYDLSVSGNFRMLSDAGFTREVYSYDSRRLERVFIYMNDNFKKEIALSEVSKLANMPKSSFSRFIKVRTGLTFTESLTEIRLGHVSRMLVNGTQSVAEIAYYCGFNNMSNFNLVFRQRKGCTPSEFRRQYNRHCVFM
jgi:AraC-like DNA-binding protein